MLETDQCMRMADDAYRRQVLAELHEKSPLRGSHGEETDELTRKLLGLARTVNYSSKFETQC